MFSYTSSTFYSNLRSLLFIYITAYTCSVSKPDTASVINIIAKGFNICLTKYSVTKTVTTGFSPPELRFFVERLMRWSKVKVSVLRRCLFFSTLKYHISLRLGTEVFIVKQCNT